jgi:hypothetical protein
MHESTKLAGEASNRTWADERNEDMKRTIVIAVVVVAMLAGIVGYASAAGIVTVNATAGDKLELNIPDTAWTAEGALPGVMAPDETDTFAYNVRVRCNKGYTIARVIAPGTLPHLADGTSLTGLVGIPGAKARSVGNTWADNIDTLTLTMGWADPGDTGVGTVTYTVTSP